MDQNKESRIRKCLVLLRTVGLSTPLDVCERTVHRIFSVLLGLLLFRSPCSWCRAISPRVLAAAIGLYRSWNDMCCFWFRHVGTGLHIDMIPFVMECEIVLLCFCSKKVCIARPSLFGASAFQRRKTVRSTGSFFAHLPKYEEVTGATLVVKSALLVVTRS